MKYDKLFQNIFLIFLDNQEGKLTSVDIVKLLYDVKDKYEMIKLTTKVNYRLNQMVESEILSCVSSKDSKTKYYSINYEKAIVGNTIINCNDEKIELGDCMIIKFAKNNFMLFFEDPESID